MMKDEEVNCKKGTFRVLRSHSEKEGIKVQGEFFVVLLLKDKFISMQI